MPKIPIHLDSCSVKVMRSHDYCHFEVSLSSNLLGLSSDEMTRAVDDLRKAAARLADKAVEQYKVAKVAAEHQSSMEQKWLLAQAKDTPEDVRTPEQKAIIKYHSDAAFASQFNYDYEDEWDQPETDD